jgi:hypothetical protein
MTTKKVVLKTTDVASGNNNNNATLTYGAVAAKSHILYGVYASYNGAPPTGAFLSIARGGAVVFNKTMTGNETSLEFPVPIGTAVAENMVITLGGGANSVGKISAIHELSSR